MKDQIEQISYGDVESNFFGAQTSQELKERLEKADKFELRGLASKVGINPSNNNAHLRELILKSFREYQARNGPRPQPKQMFAEASEDVIQMLTSIGKIGEEERDKRMAEAQKERTSIDRLQPQPEPEAKKAVKKRVKKASKKTKK